MRIQYIYDLIPLSIDRVVEEVLSKYEWVDVENPYNHVLIRVSAVYKSVLSDREMQEIGLRMMDQQQAAMGQAYPNNLLSESMARDAAGRLHTGLLGGIFG